MARKNNMPILGHATLKRMTGFKGHSPLPPTHHEFLMNSGLFAADIYVTEDVHVELLSCGHWIEQPEEVASGRDCPRCREKEI